MDGSSSREDREGRVEVCVNGIWSAICDILWTYHDAIVTCRQLNMNTLGMTPLKVTINSCTEVGKAQSRALVLPRLNIIFCLLWTEKVVAIATTSY